MASLSQTLRNNKLLTRGPGGALTEETLEETQQLAQKAGLGSPPTTAAGIGMIGGNADQQKMAGTPAQKQAALSLSQSPQNDLQSSLRRQQVRNVASQSEQAQMEKSQDMQNLGSLGSRVSQFIDTQRQKLAAQQQPLEVQAAGQVASRTGVNLQGDALASTKQLLQQLRQDPTNQQLMLQVNQALGYDISTQLNPAQVDQLYESAVDSISRGGAGTVDDKLTVADLASLPGFEYDTTQLSELLGVPAAEIEQMNVGQLRAQIDATIDREFQETQALEQKAQSGQLGQAERALARQAAQESSRTGLRASEADMSALEQQIANADQVSFGGRKLNVDELLQDETISNVIADYMNAGPDSPTRQQIDRTEPELAEFIRRNEAVLADASQQLQTGAQTFRETQTYNTELASKPFGGTKIDDRLAQALIPGYGTLQAERVDTNAVPLLQYTSQVGPDAGRTIADQLNSAVMQDPALVGQVQELDTTDLERLGIEKKDSPWATLQQNKQIRSELQNSTDADHVASRLFGTSAGNLQNLATTSRTMSALGMGNGGINSKVSAVVGPDGNIDMGALKFYAIARAEVPVLKDAARSGVQGYSAIPAGTVSTPDRNSSEGQILRLLAGSARDGSISAQDIASMDWKQFSRMSPDLPQGSAADKYNLDMLRNLRNLANKPGASIDKGAVDSTIATAKKDYTNARIRELTANGIGPDQVRQILSLEKMSLTGDSDYDSGSARTQAKSAAVKALANTHMGAFDNHLHANKDIVELLIPGFQGLPYLAQQEITNSIAESMKRSGGGGPGRLASKEEAQAALQRIADMNFRPDASKGNDAGLALRQALGLPDRNFTRH